MEYLVYNTKDKITLKLIHSKLILAYYTLPVDMATINKRIAILTTKLYRLYK